jgi:hypothetical protein
MEAGHAERMTPRWEVDGLFGNEYAMEKAVEELKKVEDIEFRALDRRNLRIMLRDDNIEARELIKNIIKIAHGFVENDGPVGELDRKIAQKKREKIKATEAKRKRGKH